MDDAARTDEDADRFVLAVKASAVAANDAVADRAGVGERLAFDSAREAETAADRFSAAGAGRVGIQRAAPQDPAAVDAYLVADPERRTRDPDGSPESGLTFDVTGNQYGTLGEALVADRPTNPPVLTHYARRDLAADDATDPAERVDPLVELDDDPDPVVLRTGDGDGDATRRWVPDCVATARERTGRVLAEYYCEVKTGDASLERAQRTVMAHKAREATVLVLRVAIEGLPESYTVRISEVDPVETPAGELPSESGRPTRLSDFE